ncbi:MAG: hypothetical protein AAGI52_01995 [Bacteroidota bacterium]
MRSLCCLLLLVVAGPAAAQQLVTLSDGWKGQYLLNVGDRTSLVNRDLATAWEIEPVSDGVVRFKAVGTDRYLHAETSETVPAVGPIQPGWLSARWKLRSVSDTQVRIENVYRVGRFLHVENGQLELGPAPEGWLSARWRMSPAVAAIAVRDARAEAERVISEATSAAEQAARYTQFLFVSDPQVTDENVSGDDNYARKMEAFVDAVNAIGELGWPDTGAPIRPAFLALGGDLTQWGGGYTPGNSRYDSGSQFRVFTRYFDRDRSDTAIDLPMYVGMGNHDLNHSMSAAALQAGMEWLRDQLGEQGPTGVENLNAINPGILNQRMTRYVWEKHGEGPLHSPEVPVSRYDSESGTYCWIVNGVHYMQFHRFGGDNMHEMRDDGQSRAGEHSLHTNYRSPGNSIEWIEQDLAMHGHMPTVVFQHLGWDDMSTEKDGPHGEHFAWWTPAEMRALDDAIAGARAGVVWFHGHTHGMTTERESRDSYNRKIMAFDGGSANPAKTGDKMTLFAVRIDHVTEALTVVPLIFRTGNLSNMYLDIDHDNTKTVQFASTLPGPAPSISTPNRLASGTTCEARTVRVSSAHSYVHFNLPQAEAGSPQGHIVVPPGSFSYNANMRCNRVWWETLVFNCLNGEWAYSRDQVGTGAGCHSNPGTHPVVTTGTCDPEECEPSRF